MLIQPSEVRDEVWMIAGADFPFVLRPVQRDDAHSKHFILLGDCCLHEYMDGEVFEEHPRLVDNLESIVLV